MTHSAQNQEFSRSDKLLVLLKNEQNCDVLLISTVTFVQSNHQTCLSSIFVFADVISPMLFKITTQLLRSVLIFFFYHWGASPTKFICLYINRVSPDVT